MATLSTAHGTTLPSSKRDAERPDFDVVIVGAGFAGMYMLHRLRKAGYRVKVLEAATDVGGTWYWNRYPGARCDVTSIDYSYSFSEELEQDWNWTEKYATQPEILRYARHVAERFDLRRDIQFKTSVSSAHLDEVSGLWTVTTDAGERIESRFVVMATGCLSAPKVPDVAGRDDFTGPTYLTGQWPHEGVDFSGQRVAVIGTGSSGIQSIPLIAEQAAQLTVFQRTPVFSLPAGNKPLSAAETSRIKQRYADYRQAQRDSAFGVPVEVGQKSALEVSPAERERAFEDGWDAGMLVAMLSKYRDLLTDAEANALAAEFVREKIRAIVDDPQVAEKLCPTDFPFGTKRPCLDTDYYAAFNRANVELVDLRETPIETITPTGIRTSAGEYEFDSIVFATGFDAMTGALTRVDIRGRNGESLADKWAAGPKSYLGIGVAGFPNFFTITGPGSPSVMSNMMVSIEQHVDWVADCLDYLRDHRYASIEPTAEAEAEWVQHVNDVAAATLYPQANSWYMGANVRGKARVFMPYIGGVHVYRQKCTEIAAAGYQGFMLAGAPQLDRADAGQRASG